jgi:hypothetical protein
MVTQKHRYTEVPLPPHLKGMANPIFGRDDRFSRPAPSKEPWPAFATLGCRRRAMRHTSPETKRRYQLGMTEQVRQAVEKSNEKAYGRKKVLRFYDVRPDAKKEGAKAVCK